MSQRLPPLPFTAAGVTAVVIGLFAYVAGWRLGWIELMITAAACLAAVVLAIPFVVGRQPLHVERSMIPDRVMVGDDTASAVVTVSNENSRRSRPVVLEEKLGEQLVRVEVKALSKGESTSTSYPLPTGRRGVWDVGPALLVKRDPLHLMARETVQAVSDRFYVHPRHVPLPALPVGFAKDLEGPTSETSPQGDVAFHALRDYQPGDDFRHIHWMSTARLNRPVVRHYVDNRRPQLLVLLDARSTVFTADSYEVAVEIVASLGVSAQLQQEPLSIWTNNGPVFGHTAPGTRDDLLDRMAEIGFGGTEKPLAASLMALRNEAGTSAIVLVTGQSPSEELVLYASQLRRRVSVIIVRTWPVGEVVPGRIPGARVIDADTLEGFTQAWRSLAA